ncbi:hypothetical protein FHR81_000804 [Actinoalloteichus hoggarensis]|uniref:Uncharacterized protein n=1 Tax=Actinoalloteichus hoggarensis TaxID=1470176 RepID=A0A221W1C7_9PSEU|nr:hypothetical protein [Actinoalloteichus hoggarensis]ASO19518.1 hypothetical protein AHOG_09370 [Actinoalloteichus hoggarensis]MBB5919775.1 hypothetical protein [Actinoalloteichus hoggarensis]
MTVSSWGDVEPGVPAHHHCLATMETAADPKHWTDASAAEPTLVAWSAGEVVEWVRLQLDSHAAEAKPEFGDGARMTHALAAYDPTPAPLSTWPSTHLPNLWERLSSTTSRGRWAMETWKLSWRSSVGAPDLELRGPRPAPGHVSRPPLRGVPPA